MTCTASILGAEVEIVTTRAMRKELARANATFPVDLQLLKSEDYPELNRKGAPLRSWRSRYFLVQEYPVSDPMVLVRLSVNRAERMMTPDGERWKDGISWDELQNIKGQCGYAAHDAIEIYPPYCDVVDVANIRHLWILREPLPFAWRKP